MEQFEIPETTAAVKSRANRGLGAVSILGLLRFAFWSLKACFILIILFDKEVYIHLGFKEIGFVLHNL